MAVRYITYCLALSTMLVSTDASFDLSFAEPEVVELKVQQKAAEDYAKPLLDLIARHEGDYNSVNRGYAGDTPGGIQSLTGLTFDQYTVGEVIRMQHSNLGAVGRYQMIRTTLEFAVNNSDVNDSDMFTPSTQDKLAMALIMHKRPAVGSYLLSEHDDIDWAVYEMAREWASIEYRNGHGYYDGLAGNKAHITRAELSAVLKQVRSGWQANG